MTQILVNPVKDDPIEPQGLDFVHIVPRIKQWKVISKTISKLWLLIALFAKQKFLHNLYMKTKHGIFYAKILILGTPKFAKILGNLSFLV